MWRHACTQQLMHKLRLSKHQGLSRKKASQALLHMRPCRLRELCVMQPASTRSKGQSRNSTDMGLLHGQESSTSGLDRMSSTQVGHTILAQSPAALAMHTAELSVRRASCTPCMYGSAIHIIHIGRHEGAHWDMRALLWSAWSSYVCHADEHKGSRKFHGCSSCRCSCSHGHRAEALSGF